MIFDFTQSKIRKEHFEPKENDPLKIQKNLLSSELIKSRETAVFISKSIETNFPSYTLHDENHWDYLWKLSDILLGDNYPLNPLEVYILGMTFIVHDLGMSILGFSDDEKSIKELDIWKDIEHSFKRNSVLYSNKKIFELVLRNLHAKRSEKVVSYEWKNSNGNIIFLIENENLRNDYAGIIGTLDNC